MPCTHYPTPEEERAEREAMEARNNAETEMAIDAATRSLREKLDIATRVACNLYHSMTEYYGEEPEGVPDGIMQNWLPETHEWIQDHEKRDAERKARIENELKAFAIAHGMSPEQAIEYIKKNF